MPCKIFSVISRMNLDDNSKCDMTISYFKLGSVRIIRIECIVMDKTRLANASFQSLLLIYFIIVITYQWLEAIKKSLWLLKWFLNPFFQLELTFSNLTFHYEIHIHLKATKSPLIPLRVTVLHMSESGYSLHTLSLSKFIYLDISEMSHLV